MTKRMAHFPAQFQYLDEIRNFVAEIASQGGFNDREIYTIQLATDEAASNIIEHAYAGVSDGEISITCEMDGSQLTIVLLDHGRSFEPASVHPPNLKAGLSERKIGGLGVYLMHKLMDDVRYETESDGGNKLTLIKRKG